MYFQYLSSVLITRSAGGLHILRFSLAFFWCPTSHGATPSEPQGWFHGKSGKKIWMIQVWGNPQQTENL